MKKEYVVMASAIVIAMSACSKAGVENTAENPASFTVKMAELQNDDETKTGFAPGSNTLVWGAGDKLYITRKSEIYGKGKTFPYATYDLASGAGASMADFVKNAGSIDIPGTGVYVALYSGATDYGTGGTPMVCNSPSSNYFLASVPTNQAYVPGGIAPYTMPMVAVSSTLSLMSFKCIANVLRFNLYNGGAKPIKIKSIELSTDSGDRDRNGIAGPLALYTDNTVSPYDTGDVYGIWMTTHPLAQGSNTISYNCSASPNLSTDSANPTVFNIVFSSTHYSSNGGSSLITAKFTYSVDGGADQVKEIVLTNITKAKRNAMGKLYSYELKDASTF